MDPITIDEELRGTLLGWITEGDSIAVYRNHAMDSSMLGHRKFLRVGPGATLKEAPQRLPDMSNQINWAYRLEAVLDAEGLEGVRWEPQAPPSPEEK